MSGETTHIDSDEKNKNLPQLTRNFEVDEVEISGRNQNNTLNVVNENLETGQNNDRNFSSMPLIMENMKYEVIDVSILLIKANA
jgi:hypothetical protein